MYARPAGGREGQAACANFGEFAGTVFNMGNLDPTGLGNVELRGVDKAILGKSLMQRIKEEEADSVQG